MERLYLDSSAIVKRYVEESGTPLLGDLYRAAEQESVLLQFSLWNVGEVLGVLDSYQRRGWIKESQHRQAVSNFAAETAKLVRLGTLNVLPVKHRYLLSTWELIRLHHIYQADALQTVTAAASNASALITADKELQKASLKGGVPALHVESDETKIRAMIR